MEQISKPADIVTLAKQVSAIHTETKHLVNKLNKFYKLSGRPNHELKPQQGVQISLTVLYDDTSETVELLKANLHPDLQRSTNTDVRTRAWAASEELMFTEITATINTFTDEHLAIAKKDCNKYKLD